MFRFVAIIAAIASAAAFAPARFSSRTQMTMAAEKPDFAKMIGVAIMASTMFSGSAFAASGTGAKQSFFGDESYSSPFTINENREDPIYSPYSPYGDGSKSVYNAKFIGSKDEVAAWKLIFKNSEKRVDNVVQFADKKQWSNVQTELKSYANNMRESMNRLAAASKDPALAKTIAKAYFSDLNDIDEWAIKKDRTKIAAAYAKSVNDITAFKALLN